MNKPKKKRKQKAPKQYYVIADSEGGLPLSDELAQAMGANIGDEYAVWKEGNGFMLVFTKANRGKRKIPKDAQWGKVEPALPEFQLPVRKPVKKRKKRDD